MDERIEKAQESAKAARAKATAAAKERVEQLKAQETTTAAKERVEQLKAQEKSARSSVKKSFDDLKNH